ncbi:MAG: hypothetical protein M1829_002693 [Trizodia sp. TS-e1964]|nr:MAG: hypothetical protein M1829_002693 [Trizodia sp. TS-e1964]
MDDLALFCPSNLLHTQEKLSQYKPGGLHPVCLGDSFQQGRFTMHHKLGWGGFSTVWLAWDDLYVTADAADAADAFNNQELISPLSTWVSIKIMTAESTEGSRELASLRSLKETAASNYIARRHDEFIHLGPNGRYQCLVFELLGPSVDSIASDYREAGDQLDPEIILKIASLLLQAIAHIHGAGYAHGDISGSNLLFTCPKLAQLAPAALLAVIGPPEHEELARLDGHALAPGLPRQLVKSADWVDWADEDEEGVRLIDFGQTFTHASAPHLLSQPADMRAPETIFTSHFDHRLDLWRAGITIYSAVFGSRPFQHWGGDDRLIPQMIGFVEELPAEWEPKWQLMQSRAG